MEYCNGGDLADYLHAKGTLSEDTICLFLKQLAGAMKALNAKGIVHRDLKPQNILLCYSGKPSSLPSDITLKIADFGFARFLQDGVMAATLCGSPMYMAPEVIMSLQYDAKADLWSIGTIVFQCLTGKAPFQAQTPQALKQFYEKNSNLVPRIPAGTSSSLTDLLLRLLKRNAKDRMEFDEFFNHPFLKLTTKLSSPEPVPNCYNAYTDSPLTSYTSNGLPFSGTIPSNWSRDNDLSQSSTTIGKLNNNEKSPLSSIDDQDFVIVPCSLPDDSIDINKMGKSTSSKWQSSENNSSKNVLSNGGLNDASDTISAPSNTTNNHLKFFIRPDTLPVSVSPSKVQSSYPRSEPIPVPSQREAYDQIQRSLQDSGSSLKSLSGKSQATFDPQLNSPVCSPVTSKPPLLHSVSSTSSKSNESIKITTDVSSLTPPSVQFAIGTPPGGGQRRGTIPSYVSRFSNPSWRQTIMPSGNPLSPVIGSPNKEFIKDDPNLLDLQYKTETVLNGLDTQKNVNSLSYSFHMSFNGRTMTLPEITNKDSWKKESIKDTSENTELDLQRRGSAGKLKSVTGSSEVNLPYSHYHSHCWLGGIWDNRHSSCGKVYQSAKCNGIIDPTPPSHSYLSFGTSPQNLDSHMLFIAPELPEETLLEKEHNETLAKLNFVLALVDCILDLARSRSTPISALTDSYVRKEILLEQFSIISEGCRRAEQLVLYMRALHLLSSSLQLSREEVHAGRLQPSTSVKNVLQILKEHFHHCLTMCKSLNTQSILHASGVDPTSSNISADRLIYNYAIDMCQSAALEELFGNPEECFRRYQTAQILLHSLAQQVIYENDKKLLGKYKMAVEKRLYVLQSQGYIYAYNTI
ncbi:serine/threonine-protein kinase ULK2-like [Centruroides sculpturatus]|uniref:serine/threonine-protein kinase ULK2-like n=1 Tax=Centruroides sculpturatus TaxID=218467 RepID=UPI000C6E79C7|nr:serine/threonine-protein kinase ULK2-like [Centruroides sculpturatus]